MISELPHYRDMDLLLMAQKRQKKQRLAKADADDSHDFHESLFPSEPGKIMKLIGDECQLNEHFWLIRTWHKDRKRYSYKIMNSKRFDIYRRDKMMKKPLLYTPIVGGNQRYANVTRKI